MSSYSVGSLATSLVLGLTAGATGQLVAVPADLIKVGEFAAFCRCAQPAKRENAQVMERTNTQQMFSITCQVRMQADGRRVALGQIAAPRYSVGVC